MGMDWFPLYNSLRIALLSTVVTFFVGILAAHYAAKTPKTVKGILDCVFTLPMVLPPTVVGFFLLKNISPNSFLGAWVLGVFNIRLVMVWYSGVFATVIVTFPLMYRTVRGAFEALDETIVFSAKTLGLSNSFIFWRIIMPGSRQGVIAGTVLAFARALGEYGATTMVTGYIPGRTATISTTVYQLWREGNDALAYRWVVINLLISFVVLVAVNLLENRYRSPKKSRAAVW
jgi:molybdate transport system permease protein